MSAKTSIEWTDATWNPVRGCSRVSEGCRNCYAERLAARFSSGDLDDEETGGQPFAGFAVMENGRARWTGRVQLIESKLTEPLHWKAPKRIFVNSMSDLFHEALPDEDIEKVLWTATKCPQHTLQILTKRAKNMRRVVSAMYGKVAAHVSSWPLPNVWLGVSVEDRKNKDRIDLLRETPAAVRFLSIEPLLEDIGELDLRGIHWVIVGGESGPKARPFNISWARNIIAQCKDAGVACFVKQLGAAAHSDVDRISHKGDPLPRSDRFWRFLNDRKGGDWSAWPKDLRVREFPTSANVRPPEAGTHAGGKGK